MDQEYYTPAAEKHMAREKARARDLRGSQWWKRRLAAGRCHYCGRRTPPRELTMDHVVPVARGGHSDRGNVVPCCKECNNRKQSLMPIEWAAYLQGFDAAPEEGSHGESSPEESPPGEG